MHEALQHVEICVKMAKHMIKLLGSCVLVLAKYSDVFSHLRADMHRFLFSNLDNGDYIIIYIITEFWMKWLPACDIKT